MDYSSFVVTSSADFDYGFWLCKVSKMIEKNSVKVARNWKNSIFGVIFVGGCVHQKLHSCAQCTR